MEIDINKNISDSANFLEDLMKDIEEQINFNYNTFEYAINGFSNDLNSQKDDKESEKNLIKLYNMYSNFIFILGTFYENYIYNYIKDSEILCDEEKSRFSIELENIYKSNRLKIEKLFNDSVLLLKNKKKEFLNKINKPPIKIIQDMIDAGQLNDIPFNGRYKPYKSLFKFLEWCFDNGYKEDISPEFINENIHIGSIRTVKEYFNRLR